MPRRRSDGLLCHRRIQTWQLIDDSAGVGFVADAGVVSLQRPYERLGHAVRLRAFDGGGAWDQADIAGEPAGVVGGIAAAVSDRFPGE